MDTSIKIRNDLAILRAKKHLLNMYGLDVDINIKNNVEYEPVEKINQDLDILMNILVQHIPAYLKVSSLSEKCRKREVVDLRMIYCKIARDKGLTYSQIGNNVDFEHTTVMYNIRHANQLLEVDRSFKLLYSSVLSEYQENVIKVYGRTSKYISPESNNPESNSVVALYPREYSSGEYNTNNECRSSDMSESEMARYSEPITA